jgi:extradiol dioxygenase family protein
LAFPVRALEPARKFYVDNLGCRVGRESERWIDFDFFGHQISAHLVDNEDKGVGTADHNEVDGKQIPVSHFGAVLDWNSWEHLAARLRSKGVEFLIEPGIRFAGQVGEQGTFFVRDPSGNCLEFKTFRDASQLFAR